MSLKQHLLIIGGGSAAFAAAGRAVELGDARVTLVNDGLPIGGTCVNVGCVPSKTLIRAAEALHQGRHSRFEGIGVTGRVTDFNAIIQQKQQLVEQLRRERYVDVIADLPQVHTVDGRARFVDSHTVEVDGERIAGDRVLIATGGSPYVAPIPGLHDAGYLTSESAFELEALPESLIVLGGRFVALECAQMFARFGSRVTILQRSDRILPTESPALTDALTAGLREDGIDVVTGVHAQGVHREGAQVMVDAVVDGERRRLAASHVLAATGRRPNTQDIGLERAGIRTDQRGFIDVDATGQTSARGVYAAGDVIGGDQYVYTAAYEGVVAAENALTGAAIQRDYAALPWVIFTDPQIAGVGLDEREALRRGFDAEASTLPLTAVPRALAARDTRGFITLIRDRASDRVLGARVLAHEGSELLMEVAMAIRFGITTAQIRQMFHPYLTLSESVKLAALTFEKDVAKLSCCAT